MKGVFLIPGTDPSFPTRICSDPSFVLGQKWLMYMIRASLIKRVVINETIPAPFQSWHPSKGSLFPDGIPKKNAGEGVRSFPIHLGVLMQLVM